ncbi:MAG: hypothetical protein GX102_15155 [Porphyromonadaceae bacterium]|nr:hypothetical protein [Porphyromonadaceae bacterium]
MEEYNDYKEFPRPDGKSVRVVFELFKNEILYHYCEFRHDANSEWISMKRDEDGYHSYTVKDADGKEREEKVFFPTLEEIANASDEINKKYNILSI